MENREHEHDDCKASDPPGRHLVGLDADDRGGVQVSAVCSQDGCMNDYNSALSELVTVEGLKVWVHRCNDHIRTHNWTRLGGSQHWFCWVCREEYEGEGSPPFEGPCVKR